MVACRCKAAADAAAVLHLCSRSCCVLLKGLMQHFAAAALEQAGRMGTGETVMVTAAAGGTGQFAVQLAKAAGNTVIATCSSKEKADMLRGLGADRVINYKTEQLGKVGQLSASFARPARCLKLQLQLQWC